MHTRVSVSPSHSGITQHPQNIGETRSPGRVQGSQAARPVGPGGAGGPCWALEGRLFVGLRIPGEWPRGAEGCCPGPCVSPCWAPPGQERGPRASLWTACFPWKAGNILCAGWLIHQRTKCPRSEPGPLPRLRPQLHRRLTLMPKAHADSSKDQIRALCPWESGCPEQEAGTGGLEPGDDTGHRCSWGPGGGRTQFGKVLFHFTDGPAAPPFSPGGT